MSHTQVTGSVACLKQGIFKELTNTSVTTFTGLKILKTIV